MINEKLIEKLIGLKLTIQDYMVMYLLYVNNRNLLQSYVNNNLMSLDYTFKLQISDYLDEGLLLTPKFEQEFKEFLIPTIDNEHFMELFEELKEHYPKKVTKGSEIRRLHSDKARCIKLYKKILTGSKGLDLDKHNHILKCIDFEAKERIKADKELFWLAMPTYLHQKAWELVEDDLNKVSETPKNNTNYDVI